MTLEQAEAEFLLLASAEATHRDRERLRLHADQIRENCRTLKGFVREAWHVVEPQALYVPGWHIDAICAHLEAVTHGQITRLLVNVPPGSAKSLLVSVLWPAWEWGPAGLPSLRYLATAYNEQPVKRDTRKMRDLVESEWFQTLWPLGCSAGCGSPKPRTPRSDPK